MTWRESRRSCHLAPCITQDVSILLNAYCVHQPVPAARRWDTRGERDRNDGDGTHFRD